MHKKNCLFGIIGSLVMTLLLLGLVVITNVFASNISFFLTILIPFSIYFGYRIFNGKISKKVLVIMIIVSVICLLITTLVLIPLLDMYQVGISLSFNNFRRIYINEETKNAILNNAVLSFSFAIISNILTFVMGLSDIKNSKKIRNKDDIEFFDPDSY